VSHVESAALAKMLQSTPDECYRIAFRTLVRSGLPRGYAAIVAKNAYGVARHRWKISRRLVVLKNSVDKPSKP
jgi:DNA-binding Lrp family transcriptional regulator